MNFRASHLLTLATAASLTCILTGCGDRLRDIASTGDAASASTLQGESSDTLAPGVVHRAIPLSSDSGIDVVDLDLSRAHARIAILSSGIRSEDDGVAAGVARTPANWLQARHALAVVNGGYFGASYPDGAVELVGLFVRLGKVLQPPPVLHGHGSAGIPGGVYVRSGFGLSARGVPSIAWVGRRAGKPSQLVACRRPTGGVLAADRPWPMFNAIGCGPTLIHRGNIVTTDRAERLASLGPQPRTFVAYDDVNGHPRHFMLGVASSATYADIAQFVAAYFPKYDRTIAGDAMCLDGGASSQLSYQGEPGSTVSGVVSPLETGTAMPDAVAIVPISSNPRSR